MPQEPTSSNWKDKLANKLQNYFDNNLRYDYHFTLSSPYENGKEAPFPPTTQDLQENEKAFEVKNIFDSLRCFFRVH